MSKVSKQTDALQFNITFNMSSPCGLAVFYFYLMLYKNYIIFNTFLKMFLYFYSVCHPHVLARYLARSR